MSVFSLSSISSPLSDSLNGEPRVVQMRACEKIIDNEINPNSSSQSSAQFILNPPSSKAILDSLLLIRAEMALPFTFVNATANNLLTDYTGKFTPRTYALNSCINSLDITINGQIINSKPKELVPFITRMDLDQEKLRLDLPKYQQLERCNNYILEAKYVQDNIFSSYADSLSNLADRIESTTFQIENTTVTGTGPYTYTSVVRFTAEEPLLHGLLNRSATREMGLSNLQTMKVDINWANTEQLKRAFCVVGDNVTWGTAQINDVKLRVKYEIPSVKVPDLITLPCVQFNRFITNPQGAVLAAGSTQIITSNAIRLSQIPDLIYIYAMKPQEEKTFKDSDGFLAIEKINIQMGDMVGVLQNSNSYQLWQMSVRNGLKMSYIEFSDRIGSVLVIDPAKDCGSVINGSKTELLLQVTATVKNTQYAYFPNLNWSSATGLLVAKRDATDAITYTPDLVIMTVQNQRVEISTTSANVFSGIDLNESLANVQETDLSFSDVKSPVSQSSLSGGSFSSFLKDGLNVGKKIFRGVKTVNNSFLNPALQALAASQPQNKYLQGALMASDTVHGVTGDGVLKGGMVRYRK